MSTISSGHDLAPTIGVIAQRKGVGLHRVRYVIDRLGVAPAMRAGQTRIFAQRDVARIERELDWIGGREPQRAA